MTLRQSGVWGTPYSDRTQATRLSESRVQSVLSVLRYYAQKAA